MKKSKQVDKNLQKKLILTTRIVGLVLFLIGIAIIIVTSIIKSSTTITESFKIDFTSTSDNFTLLSNENNILDKNYVILKSLDDYNQLATDIEQWDKNLQINNTTPLDDLIIQENDSSELSTSNRNKQIKKLLESINITESTFNDKAIIVIEDLTTNETLEYSKVLDVIVNLSNLKINIEKKTNPYQDKKISTLYFIKIDKQYVIDDINIVISNENDI